MRRRVLLTSMTAASLFSDRASQSQPVAMPVVGFLHSASAAYLATMAAPLRQGLAAQGFVDGTNLRIEIRPADGHHERLAPLARELVALKVDAILAGGGSDPANAVKAATSKIPIVFVSAADPVKAGLVASVNRPGGNVTGVSLLGSSLEPKRLEILSRLAPGTAPLGALVDTGYPDAELQIESLAKAAAAIRRQIEIVKTATETDIDAAVVRVGELHCAGLTVAQAPFFISHIPQITAAAARYRLPLIYHQREYVDGGGLISYGTNFADGYRQAGFYLGKILKGATPADLPVLQPEKFELVINQRTARALGVEIPLDLAAAADEVIE
jgi:putative ABC transport system substrate-binding protein